MASKPKVCAGLEAQHAQNGALQRRYVAQRRRVHVAALRAGEDEVRRLRMALAPRQASSGPCRPARPSEPCTHVRTSATQLALAAGLDHAERLLVEVDRAPAQREQLAAAAQAGERGGDVERPVAWEVFVTLPVPGDETPAISRKCGQPRGASQKPRSEKKPCSEANSTRSPRRSVERNRGAGRLVDERSRGVPHRPHDAVHPL